MAHLNEEPEMSYRIEIQTRESFGGDRHTVGNYSRYMAAVEVASSEVKWESTESVAIIDNDEDRVVCTVPGDFA